MDHYRVSYKSKLVTYYYPTAHIVHSSIAVHHTVLSSNNYKLVAFANLYEIFKYKIFVSASKTTKSMKILVPESFRLYGINTSQNIFSCS